jgi:hypothetical protein
MGKDLITIMKKIIILFFLSWSLLVSADPFDPIMTRRNSTDSGFQMNQFPKPSVSSASFYNPANNNWEFVSVISAFTNDSGYITSSALSPYLTSATAASTYATKSGTTAQYIRGDGTTATFPTNVSSFTNDNAYINQSGARGAISLTTTGSGVASYNNSTGVLNVPTPASVTPFNFSQPSARTINVSTSYQATDNTKAAIIYPSYACQNATQVLASSACTLQVRVGTGTLTCSTGTVYYTQSLTVNLGVLITQNSTNPVPIFLPSGGSFILCPQTGTFTVTTIEQSAG